MFIFREIGLLALEWANNFLSSILLQNFLQSVKTEMNTDRHPFMNKYVPTYLLQKKKDFQYM